MRAKNPYQNCVVHALHHERALAGELLERLRKPDGRHAFEAG